MACSLLSGQWLSVAHGYLARRAEVGVAGGARNPLQDAKGGLLGSRKVNLSLQSDRRVALGVGRQRF